MKRTFIGLCLTAILTFTTALPVYAQAPNEPYTVSGRDDWSVTFTDKQKMVSNFKTSDLNDEVSRMQPGDRVILTMKIKNEDSNATDWYMTNKVLDSLEASTKADANGGAYGYRLVYQNPAGQETVLFDSEKVGGENESLSRAAARVGLEEATTALEDYFILDTLKKGQSGIITLTVGLDGETQGNAYQDTLADLTMNFAVERRPSPENSTREPRETVIVRADTVRTADDNQLLLYTALLLTSGMVLLLLTLYCRKVAKKEEE
ncbi:hypothetical protein D5278_06475 [bacterium 1XD21-13]|nr:hypothetical protein [bacterium 1XD21-13]